MQIKYSKKFYVIIVLVITLAFSTKALASLTFSSAAITGDTASTIDVGSGNALSLQTTNNGNIITGGGNVGIGITPINKLTVSGTSNFTGHIAIGPSAQIDMIVKESLPLSATLTLEDNFTGSGVGLDIHSYFDPALDNKFNEGIFSWVESSNTNNKHINLIKSIVGGVDNFSLGSVGQIIGGEFASYQDGTGNVTDLQGIKTYTGNYQALVVTNQAGVDDSFYNSKVGSTITNGYGLKVYLDGNTGTYTNTYGVYVGDVSQGTQTNYPFSFYSSDPNSYNYFAGNVGIGTIAPSAPLEVKGSGTGATIAKFTDVNTTGCTIATGGTIACSSDVNLKKNIEDINYGLNTVMSLRPVLYNWKYEDDGSVKSLGFIAQEVETIIPKLVSTDEAGIKSLNTTGMVPVLAKAIQEMNLKIDLVASTVIPNSGSSLDSFASTFFENVFSRVRTYLGDVSNGIGDFFANRIHTKELCVAKADGTEFCANGDQFQAMVVTPPAPAPVVPTCVAPQTLVNNVCTDPAPVVPTCVAPQTLVNNVCTDPAPVAPTCVAPQTLVNNVCTDPTPVVPTCVDPQILVDNVCVDPTPIR